MTEISQNQNEPQSDKESTTSHSTALTKRKDHLWKPGMSGNPHGKPAGTKNRITQQKIGMEAQLRDQLGEYMPEVLQRAIELAIKGDRVMIKLLLEMTLSKPIPTEDGTEGKDKVQVTIRKLNIEQAQVELTPSKPDTDLAYASRGDLIPIEVINVEG